MKRIGLIKILIIINSLSILLISALALIYADLYDSILFIYQGLIVLLFLLFGIQALKDKRRFGIIILLAAGIMLALIFAKILL